MLLRRFYKTINRRVISLTVNKRNISSTYVSYLMLYDATEWLGFETLYVERYFHILPSFLYALQKNVTLVFSATITHISITCSAKNTSSCLVSPHVEDVSY